MMTLNEVRLNEDIKGQGGSSDFLFQNEDEDKTGESYFKRNKDSWKILIVDDEKDIHQVTKLVLSDCMFNDKHLEFISAYSGEEAKKLIQEHPDTALILLDVVMEEDDSGLKFVKFLRDELKNKLVRIILRTGQPGIAPQMKVVADYDINDYKEKTELTKENFSSCVILALRTFYTLQDLERKCIEMKQQSDATEKFIPRIFFEVLNKKNIIDVNVADHIEKEITVLFLDVRSFTTLSEFTTPLEAFEFLNTWIKYMEPIIRQHNGFIDKYIGDGILAFFIGKSEDAVVASINLLQSLEKYNRDRMLKKQMPIKMGIGINTGLVVIGVVGFHNRIECTVIGDAVNAAERMEKSNKIFGSSIIIGENTFLAIRDSNQFHYRKLGKTYVPGKKQRIPIYEIFDADPKENFELKQKTKEMFEHAVHLFQAGDILEANRLFKQICDENPFDNAAKYFLNETNEKL